MTAHCTSADTPRPHRKLDRYRPDDEARAFLDSQLVGHLAYVSAGGRPHAVPMMYARVGDVVYLHGSTGAGTALRTRGGPLPASFSVTSVEGLVLARAAVHHSLQFRSVVVHGELSTVTDEHAKRVAFDVLVDAVAAGRSAQCRPASSKELASTAVLALSMDQVDHKARLHGVVDDAEDLALPFWAGVVPLAVVAGEPQPDAGVSGRAAPAGCWPSG
ncbi:hypothetical protein CLV35_2403 [Motilibacter peucedani]|uniref:Nitroimidazol reductase NimA-like FMN-containing flavoprotein (Pyridoxamine 5'-phosphate oxidase superfamily) n=1 Tax=Motilibacter peucedani TaxID=598650 RepID=A0A420XNY4_9ACTN|nr:pyridoxamine 5'-phosphate oxidase family protein [Motilibacter peucedani]RKS73909.1 hypothetical protein CLV35_2403 [Motilibacter peucedani]